MNVCINVPSIVYQNVFTGETSNLSGISIFTPSGPGLFRVTATIYTSAATRSVTATIDNGSYPSDSAVQFGGSFYEGQAGTGIFTGFSTYPFLLSTVMGGTSGSYDVWITIEQLQ